MAVLLSGNLPAEPASQLMITGGAGGAASSRVSLEFDVESQGLGSSGGELEIEPGPFEGVCRSVEGGGDNANSGKITGCILLTA